LADPTKRPHDKKSKYTAERGMPGAFDGETVTRRGLMTGGAMAAGGIATAAFALPALGFALGPIFNNDIVNDEWQDVGAESDFNADTYVARVITLVTDVGESGKTTIYVRKAIYPADMSPSDKGRPKSSLMPYVAISTRCAHLGCPVRYVQASEKFICPCHGGVYGKQGQVDGGPPVRPLDRFYTKAENGRVFVGKRFSLNSKLERFPHPRDPSNHLDGLWQYLYPGRPSTA
jgi:menaquinol-cytochrome c reductase iron-sulfur subunit